MNQEELVLAVLAHHRPLYDECKTEWSARSKARPTEIVDHVIEKVGFRTRLAGEGYGRYYEALWLWI